MRINVDDMEIKAWLDRVLKTVQSQRIMHKISLAARLIIIKRTMHGRDIYGKMFQPYSRDYARKRRKKNLPVHPVTLTWDDSTGMLRKIDTKVTDKFRSAKVYFTSDKKEQLARYHNYLGVAEKGKNLREFWGFSDEEDKELKDALEETLIEILSGKNPEALKRLKNSIGDV